MKLIDSLKLIRDAEDSAAEFDVSGTLSELSGTVNGVLYCVKFKTWQGTLPTSTIKAIAIQTSVKDKKKNEEIAIPLSWFQRKRVQRFSNQTVRMVRRERLREALG